MSTALATLAGKLAERVGMDSVDPQELITTLRQTAFKGDASDAQFIALLIVANQYGLNPWTKLQLFIKNTALCKHESGRIRCDACPVPEG